MDLLHCFMSTINYGLRMGGGMGEFLPTQSFVESNKEGFYFRIVFDVSFFLIVNITLLNIIFGIIIDTFAQLRDKKRQVEHDIKNFCFICNLQRYVLDKDTEEGFDYHCAVDHDTWQYLNYIVYLKSKDATDYNGVESSLYAMFEAREISWFPKDTCLALEKKKGKKEEEDTPEELALQLLRARMEKLE